MASLFEPDEPSQAVRLAPRLRRLAEQGIFLGTSSWKYQGWLGSIYDPDRYQTRGRFSRKKFEAECLREYCKTFPTVGGDFSFYQFPTADFWTQLFDATPTGFTFGLKVPEELTVLKWPGHARYGARGGTRNDRFLDADLLKLAFTSQLEPHRAKIAVLMFEFGTFSREEFGSPAEFFRCLEPFLAAMPPGWPYAVEIRNKEFLGGDYFHLLARYNVSHVFNAWTRMPTLREQFALPDAFTGELTVVRALLRKARGYEQAVKLFEPYEALKEPDMETREALRRIITESMRIRRRAYVFVNNRLEGNAPSTIEAISCSREPSLETQQDQ
jgi:uncharacterized protein YecE (DUF72 family)